MRRTELLLPPDLHMRATQAGRTRGVSLGSLVLEALAKYLARPEGAQPAPGVIREILLAEPFDDSDPDPALSVDVDHYLYGAPRRRRSRRASVLRQSRPSPSLCRGLVP